MSILSAKQLTRVLGLAVFLLALAAPPALAAPSWGISFANTPSSLPRSDEGMEYAATVTNNGDVPTAGVVTVTIETPTGLESVIMNSGASFSNGWICVKQSPQSASQHGTIICRREDALAPGNSYPTLRPFVQLGLDAPEPSGTAVATVVGGGAATPASAQATYTFTAATSFGILENSFMAGVVNNDPGLAAATTITSVEGGSLQLSKNATVSGPQVLNAGPQPFAVGEVISGDGIPPGTTITAVGAQTLSLSAVTTKEAVRVPISSGAVSGVATFKRSNLLSEVITATGTGVLTSGSKAVTDLTTSSGTFLAGQTVTGEGESYTKGGGHPFGAGTEFAFTIKRTGDENRVLPVGSIKDVVVDAPRGFVGNALASPELCRSVEDVMLGVCPPKSVVGGVNVFSLVGSAPPSHPFPGKPTFNFAPIYSIVPEYGRPAQFAFAVSLTRIPVTFVPELRADEGYAVSFRTAPIITVPPLYGARVRLCNYGGNFTPGNVLAEAKFTGCKTATSATANPQPLITNPTRCSGPPPTTTLKVDSWEHPDEVRTAAFSAPQVTECPAIDFEPKANLQPVSHEADSPTGLTVEINMPIDGVLTNTGISQANLDTVTVTLPKGMSINAATADGLAACSLAQIKLGSNVEDECPESSKVGTVEIDTPLIRETLTGDVYVAEQNNNPFKSTLGLYMAFDSARDGVRIKVAGKLVPDPVTGQLTSIFTENPEAPFSRLALNFNPGPHAALVNPPKCGTYAIHSEFSPWSAVNPANPTPDEIVSGDSIYEVTSGPNGAPCPEGALQPKLKAGVQVPKAGAKSPFVFTLSREDGTQRFNKIEVTTPKGLTAYLKGIPYCPDGVLGSISEAEGTGRSQLANPSCPAASQVGSSQAGAGSGPDPFHAEGRVYLAGPYKGAPVSLAVVTPAVAGPFDLGNVVIRNPLYVDPVTSQVRTESDPIPTILHGIVLNVRDIRVALDHPNFIQAPTSCEPMSVDAGVSGQEGGSASISNRFQVGGCEELGFQPKLALRLFGGTHRGSHPKIQAVLTPRPGDANIAAASVALPHSEFLDQAHIRTICTRVQFAAKACPAGSIYGHAEAVTPLLDQPVSGPVYLRSSDNPLPDLVAALRGPDSQPIEVHVIGRIDSVNGGIRTTFDAVPDQPVSTFTLTMRGGKKGLLVNSRDICKSVSKATAEFTAQNGKTASMRPVLRNSCKKVRKGKGKGKGKGPKGHRSR